MLSNNLIKRDTTGAFALIDSLVRHKVKHIFGYPGGAILPIYDELYAWEQEGFIEHILVRHEQGAAHASDAYSRATGSVGVCFATSGPGATNLVTGIATAHMDSVAMVCITGQVGRSFIGTDAFQEVDIFGPRILTFLPFPSSFGCLIDLNAQFHVLTNQFQLIFPLML